MTVDGSATLDPPRPRPAWPHSWVPCWYGYAKTEANPWAWNFSNSKLGFFGLYLFLKKKFGASEEAALLEIS